MNKVDVLLGLQWGDEGKGKIVDVLTPKYDIIARFQGGPNAGHTLEFNGIKHVLHIIPSGIFHADKKNIIGNGVLVEPLIFEQEINGLIERKLDPRKNLLISKKAHLITPSHRILDAANEAYKGKDKIGSTLKGIGPTYTDKIARLGLRVGDIQSSDWKDKYERLKETHIRTILSMNCTLGSFQIDGMSFDEYEKQWMRSISTLTQFDLIDSEYYINEALDEGKKVLAEGAQGSMLDVDFGSYPFVTSSNTVTAGVCSGLGVAPVRIGNVYGVTKAYCTRVGSGPFPTELFDKDGDKLRKIGNEFGSTTGRPRRCGWIDIPALNYACMLNGVTHLILMKLDVLNEFETLSVCLEYNIDDTIITNKVPYNMNTSKIVPMLNQYKGWKKSLRGALTYAKLPQEAKDYISIIEENVKVPVAVISTSPDRKDTIFKIDL